MRRALDVACTIAVAAAAIAAAYWKVVDSEICMRLAIGRAIVVARGLPAHDPFLFVVPEARFRDPEALGDVFPYGVHGLAGEGGLVVLKLALVGAGFFLLYRLGRCRGGAPVVLLGLVLLALGASTRRFTERSEMFAYVLVPICGLVLESARRDPRRVLALLPLGVLWANLHVRSRRRTWTPPLRGARPG